MSGKRLHFDYIWLVRTICVKVLDLHSDHGSIPRSYYLLVGTMYFVHWRLKKSNSTTYLLHCSPNEFYCNMLLCSVNFVKYIYRSVDVFDFVNRNIDEVNKEFTFSEICLAWRALWVSILKICIDLNPSRVNKFLSSFCCFAWKMCK